MLPDDPRPLVGEPLSLDLLNTRWIEDGTIEDLLTDVPGLTCWLTSVGLAARCPADQATLRAVRQARDAIGQAVVSPGEPRERACAALNTVLAHGRVLRTLTPQGPAEEVETDTPAWLPGWLAAADYLRLIATTPGRIRRCAHDKCILHFLDTSQNGKRRWCSMAVCGNRAKASRHYARSRS